MVLNMASLDANAVSKAREMLSEMKDNVTILFFKSKDGCEYCAQIDELTAEIAALNPKIKVEKYVMENDVAMAKEYEIDMAPAIVLRGKDKRFVRFFGIPAGYEFSTFISDIIDVSKGVPSIPPDIAEKVKKIDFPVRMLVFVTPTCPYCPGAVKVAHDFALLNPNIRGDMIEATEFQELSEKYEVMGVPKTVISSNKDKIELTGAYPIDVVLKKILEMGK